MSRHPEVPEIHGGSEWEADWKIPIAPTRLPIELFFSRGTEPYKVDSPYFLSPGKDMLESFEGEVRVNSKAPSFLLRDEKRDQSFTIVGDVDQGLVTTPTPEETAQILVGALLDGSQTIVQVTGAMSGGKTYSKLRFIEQALRRGIRVGSIRADQSRRHDKDHTFFAQASAGLLEGLHQLEFPVERAFEGLWSTVKELVEQNIEVLCIDEIGLLYTKMHNAKLIDEEGFNQKYRDFLNQVMGLGIKVVNSQVDRYAFGPPWPPINGMIEMKRELGEKMLFQRVFPMCVGCGGLAEISAVSEPHYWLVYLGQIRSIGEAPEEQELVRVHSICVAPERTTWAIEQEYPPLCCQCSDFARPLALSSEWPAIDYPEED